MTVLMSFQHNQLNFSDSRLRLCVTDLTVLRFLDIVHCSCEMTIHPTICFGLRFASMFLLWGPVTSIAQIPGLARQGLDRGQPTQLQASICVLLNLYDVRIAYILYLYTCKV